jgi:hypothetical protein
MEHGGSIWRFLVMKGADHRGRCATLFFLPFVLKRKKTNCSLALAIVFVAVVGSVGIVAVVGVGVAVCFLSDSTIAMLFKLSPGDHSHVYSMGVFGLLGHFQHTGDLRIIKRSLPPPT